MDRPYLLQRVLSTLDRSLGLHDALDYPKLLGRWRAEAEFKDRGGRIASDTSLKGG
jgi:hypothetical protein